MNTSARINYWMFTLRYITRVDVAAWADKQIEAGHANEPVAKGILNGGSLAGLALGGEAAAGQQQH
jgi:hypothetical protein